MSRRRTLSRTLLASIGAKLAEWPDPARSKLTFDEVEYLREMCEAALADRPDPLRIARDSGGQADRGAELLSEARLVHAKVRALGTLRAACEAVGAQLHRDGSKSGAVEKNYRLHRGLIIAADRFYRALNSGDAPSGEDVRTILKGK